MLGEPTSSSPSNKNLRLTGILSKAKIDWMAANETMACPFISEEPRA